MFVLENTCCFTGHRFLKEENKPILREVLFLEVIKQYRNNGIKNFISGGARGFDILAGYVVLKAKKYYDDINLHLFLPCENQDNKWNVNDKILYKNLLSHVNSTTYISLEYFTGCMQKRNIAMVDKSTMCISYFQNRNSGTKVTLDYAQKKNLKIINIAPIVDENSPLY